MLGICGGRTKEEADGGNWIDSGRSNGLWGLEWKRKWQPTLVFLPGKSCRQRGLAGYNPWGGKELDMTYQLSMRSRLDRKGNAEKMKQERRGQWDKVGEM